VSIKEKIGNAGGVFLGGLLLLFFLMFPVALIFGAAEISIWALKWLPATFSWTLLVTLVLFVPLAIFPSTRGASGNGIVIASYIFGTILWLWAMAITYSVWGMFALILGLMFFGVGVVPVAILAVIFEGEWMALGNLVFLFVLTFASRGLGNWLIEKAALRQIYKDYEREQQETLRPTARTVALKSAAARGDEDNQG
jgi:hypothetical protein